MTPEQYGKGDWTPEEIGAAKALWEHNNPHRPVSKLHPSIADAWMIYLHDARIARNFAFAK